MKIRSTILSLLLPAAAFAAPFEKAYVTPNGELANVRLLTEAVDWVEENVQGLDLLSEDKKTGLYYITSLLYRRFSTLDSKRAQYDELYRNMKPSDESYSPFFVKEGIKIMILGPKEYVTDLPEYAHWRGKTVEEVFGYPGDTRLMDTIDGEATRNTCLLKEHRVGRFPKGSSNTFYHELGHFVHMTTMTLEEFFLLEKLYLSAKSKNAFLDDYAAQSVHEYFAQGLEAFVAETKTEQDKRHKYTKSERKDLLRIDPGLHQLIESMIEAY